MLNVDISAPKSLSEVVWNRGRRIGEEKLRMLNVARPQIISEVV